MSAAATEPLPLVPAAIAFRVRSTAKSGVHARTAGPAVSPAAAPVAAVVHAMSMAGTGVRALAVTLAAALAAYMVLAMLRAAASPARCSKTVDA